MEKGSCLLWFSGTGNSLYAAKRLSQELSLPLTQITGAPPPACIGGEGMRVGFVFPSYYGHLPRAVKAFVEGLSILPGTDLFAVVTMGAIGQGSIGVLRRVLAAKGHILRYGRGVRMPANYVASYSHPT